MSTDTTPTLDTLLLFDELPFNNIDATEEFSLLADQPPPPSMRGFFLADAQLVLPPFPDAVYTAELLDLGPPIMGLPPLEILADVGGNLLLVDGLDIPVMVPSYPAADVAGADVQLMPQPADFFGHGAEAYGPAQVTTAATGSNHQLSWQPDLSGSGTTLPASPPFSNSNPMAGFVSPDASFPYPMATPAFGDPASLGIQYSGPIGAIDADAAGHSTQEMHPHDGGQFAYELYDPAFGLYTRQEYTSTPPGQPQGTVLSDIDESASSPSTSELQSAGPSRKRGRSNDAADDGEGEAKRQKVKANMSLEQLLAEPRRVRFKYTPAGQLCATRHYKSSMPMPVTCFLCDEEEFPPGIVYTTWAAFTRHIASCEAKDHPERWPVCHFCGVRIHAYKRPDQMVRHMVGGQGNKACKGLQDVLHSGVKTNGALADWLVARSLPIRNEFLGKKLAKALRSALLGKQVGRDEKHNLPLVKQKAKET